MDEQISVSIIIPVYNCEKYIKRCLESILNQESIDFEVLVINDGSTDKTEPYVRQYLNDARVRYFYQENKGVSAARNIGIKNAKGKYLIFVDADDYLPPDSLEKRIDDVHGYDLHIGGIKLLSSGGQEEDIAPCENALEIDTIDALKSISPLSAVGYQGFPVNKVFVRKIVIDNDIFFDEHINYGEDRLFVGEYITHCNRIVISPDIVYVYEQNAEGAMASFDKIEKKNEKQILTEFDGLKKIESIVKTYDRGIYYSFRYYEFRQAINFLKNSDSELKKFRQKCITVMLKNMSISVFFYLFYSLPRKIRRL